MTYTIQLRRDTAANWTADNPVLAQGELGTETDTAFAKLGDGVTAWNSLGYWNPSAVDGEVTSVNGYTGAVELAASDVGAAALSGAAFTGPVSVSESAASGGVLIIANAHTTPSSASVQLQAAAASDALASISVIGDTFPRLQIDSTGKMQWGTGAALPDTTLQRTGSGSLTTNSLKVSNFGSGGNILNVANTDATPPTAPNVQFVGHNAGDQELGISANGDTQQRLLIDSNGKMTWGPGGSTAGDTNFYRTSAGVLQTDNSFQANSGYVQASRIVAAGITGANATSRYVGATTGGPPNTGTFLVGDFVLDNGTGGWWICTTAGSPGLWDQGGGNDPSSTQQLASGETVFTRIGVGTGAVMTSGDLCLSYWTAMRSEAINHLEVVGSSIAAGATPTYAACGVYSVDGSGNLTQVAATASDTTMFNGIFQTKSLPTLATWNKVGGQRYAFALLMVSSFTMPNCVGFNGTMLNAPAPPRVCGFVAGQSSLQASYAIANVSNSSSAYWGAVLP